MMRLIIVAVLLIFIPLSATAKWYEASTDHFIIYANDSEKDVRRFSQQLEQYHSALEKITNVTLPKPSPSNRVTVYVLKSTRQLKKLYGEGGRYIGGFYIPRAGGSVAYVPRIKLNSRETDFSMITLMHEYAHHFMISNSDFSSPRWLSEGIAEFLSSTKFNRDGSLVTGRPAVHRAAEIVNEKEVTVEELLDPSTFDELRTGGYDSFYGRSWLLYHYLVFSDERRGQLTQYLNHIRAGKTSLDAGIEAFGSLSDLGDELNSYFKQRNWTVLSFEEDALEVGDINVRQLREAEEKIMDVRIRSDRGVNRETALEIVSDARKVASRYPTDPTVMAALAEAEYDAGNDLETIAAADIAIAGDQNQANAYVQKGYALFRQARNADNPEEAYTQAFAPFLALNKIENDHPLPLLYYFERYNAQGNTPTELAVQGLERALELAPFASGLRMRVVYQQIRDQRYDAVLSSLLPIAFSPHGGSLSLAAQQVLERIEQGPINDPDELLSLFSVESE